MRMKYLIPVLVGGATITVAITTALAQAHGAFNGHVSLVPYLYGYGAAAVLLVIASVLAMNAHRQEEKKDAAPPPIPSPVQENTQTVSQHFSPQFNPQIHIGYPAAHKAPEPDDDAIAILGFMRRVRPAGYHEVEKIATALNLTVQRTWDVLVKLEKEGRVDRASADQAFKGALWRLDELERLPVSAQALPKPESNIKCIEIKNVGVSCLDGCFHQASPGDVSVSLACFRNDPTGQTAVAEPSLRAHVIYRDSSGNEVSDLPMGVWLDQPSEIAEFRLGDKKCLIILLFNPRTKKRMKVWNELQQASFGTFVQIRDEELPGSIASIEVNLLAAHKGACLVHTVLVAENLEDELPSFKARPNFGTNILPSSKPAG